MIVNDDIENFWKIYQISK